MKTSYISTKSKENNSKKDNLNCICCQKEKYITEINQKIDSYMIKNNNNHQVFYSNQYLQRNKIPNSSGTFSNLYKSSLYKSDSKENNEDKKTLKQNILRYTKINNKYQNINRSHNSYEKNQENKFDIRNSKTKNFNNNNLKYIKVNNEVNSPMAKKTIEYIPHNNINNNSHCNDNNLSKTFQNFKKRDNYGYREIKDIKVTNNNNQSNKKNNDQQIIYNYKSNIKEISGNLLMKNNNNQENNFRNSLNRINNKIINNDIKKYNNFTYNVSLTNQNKNKFTYVNFQTSQKRLRQIENINFITYNCSSFRGLNKSKGKEKENPNFFRLTKKYIINTPENTNTIGKKTLVKYIKRNENNINNHYYLNSNDIDKNRNKDGLNLDKQNLREFRDTSANMEAIQKSHQNNNKKNIVFSNLESNFSNQHIISDIFNHNKQKSFNNNSMIISNNKNSKKDETLDANIISLNNKKNHLLSNNNHIILENKSNNNNNRIYQKTDNKKDQICLNKESNKSDNNNKTEYQQKQNIKNKIKYIKNNTNLIQTEIKNSHKKIPIQINSITQNNLYKKEKDKSKKKEIINYKSKSLEKKSSKGKLNKRDLSKQHNINSRSKSKTKKHSKCIKYLDNLKIFKFSETGYAINNNESSTTSSKDNNEKNYRRYIIKTNRSNSKKKKNINSFNLQYKTFEEDFRINMVKYNKLCKYLKPQNACRLTLSKYNNVNIVGLPRYFKFNYYCSENIKGKYDTDSEDTSDYYNNIF